jgi:hypothetical protein
MEEMNATGNLGWFGLILGKLHCPRLIIQDFDRSDASAC